MLPDGRVFVIGATGFTAFYTVPPIANQPGTWANGPTIPQVNPGEALGTVDAPASFCFSRGPITASDAHLLLRIRSGLNRSVRSASNPINSNGVPYFGRMLMLPTGQVLYTHGTTTVELYTPDGTYDPGGVQPLPAVQPRSGAAARTRSPAGKSTDFRSASTTAMMRHRQPTIRLSALNPRRIRRSSTVERSTSPRWGFRPER